MISLAIEGAIAIATLSRPPVNAISEEWVARLDAVLDAVGEAGGVGVLWLRSAERAFCAGADLALMRSIFASDAGRARMIDLTRRMQQVFARIERMPQVTLAEIGGAALGGGLELALACDLRVAADSAQLGLPEARLGLLPAAGGTQRLTRLCGAATARRLILGAEVVSGAEALRMGLVQWSAPAADLEGLAGSTARRIAGLPAAALAACKDCIGAALDASRDGYAAELDASAALLATPEARERVGAFLDRRAG